MGRAGGFVGRVRSDQGRSRLQTCRRSLFEAITTATGPDGALSIKETIAYRPEGKTLARWITDGRGFAGQQIASVGGDLGGFFNLYFEDRPCPQGPDVTNHETRWELTSPRFAI